MDNKQPEKYIGETEKNLNTPREGEGEVWNTTTKVAQLTGTTRNTSGASCEPGKRRARNGVAIGW